MQFTTSQRTSDMFLPSLLTTIDGPTSNCVVSLDATSAPILLFCVAAVFGKTMTSCCYALGRGIQSMVVYSMQVRFITSVVFPSWTLRCKSYDSDKGASEERPARQE